MYGIKRTSVLFYIVKFKHIGGKQFIAKQTVIEINELVNQISIMSTPYQHIFKLTKSEIHYYLNQCRRKNSVLEPSLSAIYQLRLTDEAFIITSATYSLINFILRIIQFSGNYNLNYLMNKSLMYISV